MARELNANLEMLRLAARNVRRNWRHSLATMLAIASGFAAVSLFDGFMEELKAVYDDSYSTRGMLGDVVVQRKDAQLYAPEDQFKYSLDATDQRFLEDFLAKDPDVAHRVRFLGVSGLATAGDASPVFVGTGYDVKEGLAIRGSRWAWNAVAGRPFADDDEAAIMPGMTLGNLLGCERTTNDAVQQDDGTYVAHERPFQCKVPRVMLSATTEAAQVNAIELKITGFIDAGFREADKRAVQMPLKEAQRLLDTDKISLMAVGLRDPGVAPAFIERLSKAAVAAGRDFDVLPWREHPAAATVKGGLQILRIFRNLFMTVVVTIGVMSVANTMMKAVNERIREIGTLRSLGFLRRHLTLLFALEGALLSLVACALGLTLTVVLGTLVSHLGLTYRAGVLSLPIALKVRSAPWAWAASTVLLSVLATGTAWLCARRAARMVVADAMRHV